MLAAWKTAAKKVAIHEVLMGECHIFINKKKI